MFRFFGGRHSRNEISIVFTIGSTHVAGAVIGVSPEGKMVVHATVIFPLIYQERLNTERFTRSMYGALADCSSKIKNEEVPRIAEEHGRGVSIKEVHCVFAAPWYLSQTRTVTMVRQKSFTVTRATLNALRDEERILFEKERLAQYSPYTLIAKQTRGIESELIATKLNDYTTANPEGHTAHKISATFYMSVMSTDILNKAEELLERAFPEHSVEVSTSALVAHTAIRTLLRTGDRYLILEINGEITEVSIVESGVLLETSSYPLGANSLIRHLQKKLRLSDEHVRAKLKLLMQAKADRVTKEHKRFEEVLYDAINEWQDGLYHTLERIAKGRPVPQMAFVMVDPTWEVMYTTALKEHTSSLFTYNDRSFTVASINAPAILRHCDIRPRAMFLPLAILAGLIHNKKEGRTRRE